MKNINTKNKLDKIVVYTTKAIIDGKTNELIIYHDNEGDWQALDFSENTENFAIISMEDLLNIDLSVEEILDMPKGHKAFKKNGSWKIVSYEE